MNSVLPEDVLRQILVNLPVKTLLRFCCVSKTWCDLINSPYFACMHLNHAKNHNNNHHRVVLVKKFVKDEGKTLLSFHSYLAEENGHCASLGSAAAPDIELPSSNDNMIKLYGTHHGVVCIAELPHKLHLDSDRDKIYLYNPATRELMTLPSSSLGCSGVFLRTWELSIGFGFDPSIKDYKVIKFSKYRYKDSWEAVFGVEIYQLGTNSWRRFDIPPPDITWPHTILSFPASLEQGSIMHWCAGCIDNWWQGILSFNISTEAFQKIEFPCDEFVGFPNLAVLDDCLAFLQMKSSSPSDSDRSSNPISVVFEHSIDIWVMMKYGIKESWVKKFSIEPLSFIGIVSLVCTSWNNDILLFQSNEGHLISCSLKNNSCREIRKFDICEFSDIEAKIYEEGLVCLK